MRNKLGGGDIKGLKIEEGDSQKGTERENPFGAHHASEKKKKAFGGFECRRATKQRRQFANAVHPFVGKTPGALDPAVEISKVHPVLDGRDAGLASACCGSEETIKTGGRGVRKSSTPVETKQDETRESAEEGRSWERRTGQRREERHGFSLTEPCDQER